MVGIYQSADPLPLYRQPLEGNRHLLVLDSSGTLAMAICTLALS